VFLLAILLPLVVAFKLFQSASKRYAGYQRKRAEILLNSTVAIDKGALALD